MNFKPKLFLNVPYELKDQAKELGCFWDPEFKLWYLPYNKMANREKLLKVKNGNKKITVHEFGYYQEEPKKKNDIDTPMFF